MNYYCVFLSITLFFVSCIPVENPVKPFDRGGLLSSSVNIGTYYGEQIFFSLERNEVVSHNHVADWDIGFACGDNDYEIILNYGKFMRAAELISVDFNDINKEVIDGIPKDRWNHDNSKGKKDSTAIGKWWIEEGGFVRSDEKVYVIDRGVDEKAKMQGMVKFQIIDYIQNTYSIRFADVKDGVVYTALIKKDEFGNFVRFSFDDGGKIARLEPKKSEWDIIFSKYTQLLYADEGEKMWYSVTGAYLNPLNVESAFLTSDDFQSVSIEAVDTLSFSSARNAIGHTWKYYDMQTGSYSVRSNNIYIIKSVSGFYYKLHFVDFYDNSGNKGCPKFEYQKL